MLAPHKKVFFCESCVAVKFLPNFKVFACGTPAGRSAIWLAHLLWEQGVEGSNPFAPTKQGNEERAGIAQLARAMAFQAVGRGFESRFPLHKLFLVRL